MAGQFLSPDGDLEKIFVDDYAMIDQYAKTGSLWMWGRGNSGQLGDNTTVAKSSPVQTISGGTSWKQVSCGYTHTTAIKTDGTLWAWGSNYYGPLGDNTITNKSSPVQTISAGTNWKQVSCGHNHTAAIKTDGTLWMWGRNNVGQLGDNTILTKSSPVQTISAGTNWKQIDCGGNMCGAIKTDGTLWLWGNNSAGQLGDNTLTNKSSPVQTISGGTNWQVIAVGDIHAAAIKTDGTLWTWGSGSLLGQGVNTNRSSPIQTVSAGTNWKQVACGYRNTAAIKTDGTLWMWGENGYGQLGDGTTGAAKLSPVQTISGGTNWKMVACAGKSYTISLKTDGSLWTWGRNGDGQLGHNNITNKSTPTQTVSGGTNWKQIAGGYSQTAAVYFYDAGNLYPSA